MAQAAAKEKFLTWRYGTIMSTDLLLRVCITMQATLYPLYVLDKGFSPAVAGLTTTAFMAVAFALRPVSGKLVDSLGRHPVFILGTVIYLLASGFYLFEIPAWLFLAMRGLQGIGFCFFGTALITLATDLIPKSRMSEGIGYLGLTRTIAGAFPPLLALALKDAYGYQVTFLVAFGIAVLALVAGFALRLGGTPAVKPRLPAAAAEKQPPTAAAGEKVTFWDKVVDRDALKPSTLMLFFMFASSWVGTFVVAYGLGQGIGNPGAFFTASAISTAFARVSVGKLSQKFGSVAALAPGITLTSLSLLCVYSSTSLSILILAGALYGLGMGMVQPELNSLAVLAARDENRGLANSTFFMAMDLGMATGASLMGVVASYAGMGLIFLIGSALTGMTLFGYLFFERRGLLTWQST